MKSLFEEETDQLIQVLRHRHVLAELKTGALERKELEERLDVSRATSHRYVRTLEEYSIVTKENGRYALTDLGDELADAVAMYETTVGARLRLAPMVAALQSVNPPIEIEAFIDATVTDAKHGDPFAPLTRFITLVKQTDLLRGINTSRIAPTYMDEFRGRILAGMQMEQIEDPEIAEDVMERYPEKCVQVCVSGNLKIWIRELNDSFPLGLVLFDDSVGIGLFESKKGTLTTFIDTDERAAIEWANDVFSNYQAESVELTNFTKQGLRDALVRP